MQTDNTKASQPEGMWGADSKMRDRPVSKDSCTELETDFASPQPLHKSATKKDFSSEAQQMRSDHCRLRDRSLACRKPLQVETNNSHVADRSVEVLARPTSSRAEEDQADVSHDGSLENSVPADLEMEDLEAGDEEQQSMCPKHKAQVKRPGSDGGEDFLG